MHRSQAAVLPDEPIPDTRAGELEGVAAGCDATVLIAASSGAMVEAVARRIHGASCRATAPFIRTWAGALPADPLMLRGFCSDLIHAASRGSLLLADVEHMPPGIQDSFIDLLVELQGAQGPSAAAAVRLLAGTSIALYPRAVAGTFSERLFYQLNVIHLVVED